MQKDKIIKIAIFSIIIIINLIVIAALINNIKTNVKKIENGDIEFQAEESTINQLSTKNNNKLHTTEILQVVLIIVGLVLLTLSGIILIKSKKLLL